MQSTITRRAALTGTAAGAAAIVAGTVPALADRGDPAIRDLWAAWCTTMTAVRKAHDVISVNGVPVGVENREMQNARLQALTDEIAALSPSTPASMAVKLAHWKWYRHDFHRNNHHKLLLPAYDALAAQSGIDFDRIALDAGLHLEMPDGTVLWEVRS